MRNEPKKITIRLSLDPADPFDAVITAWLASAGGPPRKVIRHALYNVARGFAAPPLAANHLAPTPPPGGGTSGVSPARGVVKGDDNQGEGGDDVPGLDEIIGRF